MLKVWVASHPQSIGTLPRHDSLREDQPPLTSLYQYLVMSKYLSPELENPSASQGAAAHDGVGRRGLAQRLPFCEASFADSRLPIAPQATPWPSMVT